MSNKRCVKDTEHFLLLCYIHNEIRHSLLNSVNAILLPHGLINLSNGELINILLYGQGNLSLELNAKILSATLDYIQVSKRFE